jgi:GntR family transcriptional regulator/MocR family aminotransferase
MVIPLDYQSRTPLFRQLEAWLRNAVVSGALTPGTRLPATRTLAADMGISRTTVDAAYSELVSDGLFETRGSGGTVVSGGPRIDASVRSGYWPAWQRELSGSLRAAPATPPRTAIVADTAPGRADRLSDVIDFSSGCGDDSLFPLAGFLRGLKARCDSAEESLVAYAEPAGDPGLRRAIARISASRGLILDPDRVLVSGGSQQALALAALAMARPGDTALVEEPGYASGIALFKAMGLRVEALTEDAQGPTPEGLAEACSRSRPRFVYLMPDFRNPTGTCIGAARRRGLVAAAESLGVPIIEDDYAGGLRYEGRPSPSLMSLARPGMVIHTGTFSKLLAPGLAVGFLAAEGPAYEVMLSLKALAGMSVSRLLQRGLEDRLGVGDYRNHVRKAIRLYSARRDAMSDALRRYLPEARFEKPAGGLFIWAELPRGDWSGLRAAFESERVRVGGGAACFAEPGPDAAGFLRLNFARAAPDAVEEGVARLARAVRAAWRVS